MKAGTSIAIALTCSPFLLQAQQSDTRVDQLAAPSSPGVVILGGGVTSIEKPTNTTDLALSLLSSGDNASLLPSDYAIDLNPHWLFGGHNTTFNELISDNDIPKNILQSFQVSFASRTTSQETGEGDSTLLGFGFKFSILRGIVSSEFLRVVNDEIKPKLAQLNTTLAERIIAKTQDDPTLNLIRGQIRSLQAADAAQLQLLLALDSARTAEIVSEVTAENEELASEIERLASETKFVRYGFKLDVAGAVAVSFPMQSYSDRELSRFGIWLTGGYESEPTNRGNAWSFLGVIRYLQNYDESYLDINDQVLAADNSYLDVGVRVIYTYQDKISVSGELINRQNISDVDKRVDETMRYTLNLNYQLPDNKLITFTYGKDFSGAVNNSGNLVAALGLVVGIGSKRPLP